MRSLLPLLALLLVGCPSWGGDDDDATDTPFDDDDATGDDDDAGDDDDSTGDDDDATNDPGAPEYADEELWFALRPGSSWRYTETTSVVPNPLIDDVLVTVVRRFPATDLGTWSPELTALEVDVDRLVGDDATHWLGLSGTGDLVWLGTEHHTGFETETIPGDGGLILSMADDLVTLENASFDAAWMLADEGSTDVSVTANGEAAFVYASGPTDGVDCLETELERAGSFVGLQYFRPEWGILGMELDLSGTGVSWEIVACSLCPQESGLPAP
mgnify:FL=1